MFFKNLSYIIAISGQASGLASGIGHRQRLTFWLTILTKPIHNAIRHFFLFIIWIQFSNLMFTDKSKQMIGSRIYNVNTDMFIVPAFCKRQGNMVMKGEVPSVHACVRACISASITLFCAQLLLHFSCVFYQISEDECQQVPKSILSGFWDLIVFWRNCHPLFRYTH